eukprot:1341465-Amorphochlora_amoeboformis.AAC.1
MENIPTVQMENAGRGRTMAGMEDRDATDEKARTVAESERRDFKASLGEYVRNVRRERDSWRVIWK